MSLDSRQQAEAILLGSVECCHYVNTFAKGHGSPPSGDGGFLGLVFQKQFRFSLGVELFTPAIAIDFAVNDVACFPIVQPMFDLHLYTHANVGSLPVKWH